MSGRLTVATFAALVSTAQPFQAQSQTSLVRITETLIANAPEAAASPDLRHVAYWRVDAAGKATMYRDSHPESGPYDAVSSPRFSPDSKRLAFVATSGQKKLVVVDGVAGKPYDFIDTGGFPVGSSGLLFSPDSQRFAYAAKEGEQYRVVVDGREGPAIDGTLLAARWQFSPDSVHFAYGAVRSGRQFVVLDGKEGKAYDYVATRSLFDAGSHAIYAGKQRSAWITVRDEVEGSVVSDPLSLAPSSDSDLALSSRDGRHKAAVVAKSNKNTVIFDGRAGRDYDSIYSDSLVFSPDSRHLVYFAREGQEWVIVVDDEVIARYRKLVDTMYSGTMFDGAGMSAKALFDGTNRFHAVGIRGTQTYIIDAVITR